MDCFLKDDTSSGFLNTPPVRLEVHSNRDEVHEIRYENEWPIARTQYTKLHLNGQPQSLSHLIKSGKTNGGGVLSKEWKSTV